MLANKLPMTQAPLALNEPLPDPWIESVSASPTSPIPPDWKLVPEYYPLIVAAGIPTALRITPPKPPTQPNTTQLLLLDAIKLGNRIDQALQQQIGQLLALLYWVNAS